METLLLRLRFNIATNPVGGGRLKRGELSVHQGEGEIGTRQPGNNMGARNGEVCVNEKVALVLRGLQRLGEIWHYW